MSDDRAERRETGARALRVVRCGPQDPFRNMALDEALLAVPGPPTLRLYGWSREALSLGWFQRPEDFAELLAALAARGVPRPAVVRRVTGGGAIHHSDEVTFALVVPATLLSPSVPASYRAVHDAVIAALARLGVAARYPEAPLATKAAPPGASLCFAAATAHDLVRSDGAKLLGSAQRRSGGRVLHQGCLPLQPPRLTPGSGALFRSRAEVEPVLAEEIASALGLVPEAGCLLPAEEAAAERLLTARATGSSFSRRR